MAVVDFQVIQDQKHLEVRVLDQPGHEFDQHLGGYGFPIEHEPYFATVGNRRNHIHSALGGIDANHRGFAFGSEPLGVVGIVLDAGFITPVDFGFLLLGSVLNLGIGGFQPLGYRLGILLMGTFGRFLRGETPALQIVGNGAQWQVAAIELLDGQAHGVPGPQGKRQF